MEMLRGFVPFQNGISSKVNVIASDGFGSQDQQQEKAPIVNEQRRKMVAQLSGATEYTDCTSVEGQDPSPNEGPGYDTKQSDGTGALGNAEYPFIAVAPRSTLARSGSTW